MLAGLISPSTYCCSFSRHHHLLSASQGHSQSPCKLSLYAPDEGSLFQELVWFTGQFKAKPPTLLFVQLEFRSVESSIFFSTPNLVMEVSLGQFLVPIAPMSALYHDKPASQPSPQRMIFSTNLICCSLLDLVFLWERRGKKHGFDSQELNITRAGETLDSLASHIGYVGLCCSPTKAWTA